MLADGLGLIFTPARRLCALLAFIPLLAACTVETSPGPVGGGRPIPGPSMCTMEYAPVCGDRGGRRQTLSNACEARTRGFDIVHRGECRREPDVRACTREYNPVCGERRGRQQTFANACEARNQGFQVVARGECRRQPDRRPDRETQRMCTMEYALVCAERGGRTRTFPNSCTARNDGFRVIGTGECRR
jgi:hypothetical protein